MKKTKKTREVIALENPDDERTVFFRSSWRPLIAYSYIAINIFDFIIAPISRMIYATYNDIELLPWESLTTSNGGVFHVAMGAILGAAAWTRGHENIERARNYRMIQRPYDGEIPEEERPVPPYEIGN